MAASKNRTGRQERSASASGRARRPDLSRFYRNKLKDVRPGEFEFRLTVLYGGEHRAVLDRAVQGFNWSEEESVLSGEVTLRRPDPDRPQDVLVSTGDRVRCEVQHAGAWYELWVMRAARPTVAPVDGTVTVPLKDDLQALRRSRRHWVFRKTKQRKKGWNAREVTLAVCRREGIRVGSIAHADYRLEKIDMKASGLDVLKKAWSHERAKSGKRFFIRFRDGKLEVVTYQRNRILYTLGDAIQEVTLTETQAERPVTVILARGRIGKGKAAKKVRHTEYRRAIVRRFGYVPEEKDYGRVRSVADLRLRARRDLAKKIRVRREGSVSLPGIPFIRRGDGLRVLLREPGWHGETDAIRDRSYVFATGVTHTVAGRGEYRSDISFVQEDPFVKDRARRDREERARKRRARERRRA